ncbi:MAG: T9SS type A sorting domain-containing protein, partial [Proteobacteria bacterium]
FTNSTIVGNDARREGGGLWNQTGATLNVNNCTIDANTASGPDATHGGGGIFNNGGTLAINSSTLSNNVVDGALGNGGGLHVKTGSATILTSTFSGNSSLANGGGIYSNASLNVNASTVADNNAVNGGGIYNNSATPAVLKNTISATNSATMGTDVWSLANGFTSGGYNLIGSDDASVFTAIASDIEGGATAVDPLLGPLANNGGTTFTHALLTGSPAYNTGDPADLFNDQIGMGVFGGIRDIGAYEAQSQLGIDDVATGNLKRSRVFPNPSKGLVTVELTEAFSGVVNARLIDMASGKVVREFTINETSSQLRLDGNATGIYVLQLQSEGLNENHKLVITN